MNKSQPDKISMMKAKEISLEDAMLMTGFGKYNVYIFCLCVIIMTGMIFETLGLSYIIPAAQCDLELTLTQKGWLAAVPFIGVILSSHFWGWLADTRGRKPVITGSMAMGSFISIISSFSPNLASFAVLRVISSIFIAAPSSVVVAYLGEFNNPKERDRMVTFTCAFITFGSFLLPGIAWIILPMELRVEFEFLGIIFKSWRLLIIILALPYLICSLVMTQAPETPKFLASVGKTEESFKIIKNIYFANNGRNKDPFQGMVLQSQPERNMSKSALKSMWEQTVPLFQRPLLYYTLIAFLTQFGTFSTVNGFYMWLPEMLNRMLNQQLTTNVSGTICEILKKDDHMAVPYNETKFLITECVDTIHNETFIRSMILGAIYSPFAAAAAFLVNRIGKRNILIYTPLVCGICIYTLYWSTSQNFTLFLLAFSQIDAICIGMMNATVVELFPTHLRAMAVSLSLMMGRVGSIFGSNLIGYLIEVFCPVNFFLFGSLLIVNCIICTMLPKPTTNSHDVTV